MRISELMTKKGTAVHTVAPAATIGEAVTLLAEHHVGALVVSRDGEHIEGIVSERDVVRRLSEIQGAVVNEPVHSIMSGTVYTCSLDDDIESLMETMTGHRIRHVPVLVDNKLAGIVSIGDVVKARIEELKLDRDHLVHYITAR